MIEKFPFVVLAGSPSIRDPLMEYADVDYKAMIQIKGKTMIDYVLEAIASSGCATYILIAGLPEELVTLPKDFAQENISFLHLEGRMVDKIHGAAKRVLEISHDKPEVFQNHKKIVMTSGDIPALTPEALRDYVQSCSPYDYSFYHSMIPREIMESHFPDSGRSYFKFRDIQLCAADLDMVDAQDLVDNYETIKKLTDDRKYFARTMLKFSPLLMFRYIFRRVKFEEAPGIMTHFFGIKSTIVPQKNPVVGFDVDKPHQLDMMQEYFRSKDK